MILRRHLAQQSRVVAENHVNFILENNDASDPTEVTAKRSGRIKVFKPKDATKIMTE